MNSKEARRILHAYRPGQEESCGADFDEALLTASEDPELAGWLDREIASDAEIRTKLEGVPVPADLRQRIVAPASLSPPPRGWRRHVLATAAAAVLLAAIGAAVLQTRRPALAPWQADSLATLSAVLSGAAPLDVQSPDSAELRRWLKEKDAPDPAALPASLDTASTVGCKRITVEGRPVSIICFHASATQLAHLVTVDERALPNPPPERKPRYVKKGEWSTASWSAGGQSFMLAMKAPEPELRALL